MLLLLNDLVYDAIECIHLSHSFFPVKKQLLGHHVLQILNVPVLLDQFLNHLVLHVVYHFQLLVVLVLTPFIGKCTHKITVAIIIKVLILTASPSHLLLSILIFLSLLIKVLVIFRSVLIALDVIGREYRSVKICRQGLLTKSGAQVLLARLLLELMLMRAFWR